MSRNKTFRLLALARPGRLLLALALSALLFSGCAASHYVSKTPSWAVKPIALLEPLSEITFIDRNGVQAYNDTLSAASTAMLSEILTTLPIPADAFEFPVETVIPYDYSGENNEVAWDVGALAGVLPGRLRKAGVPDAITNLLRENGYRYGMLVYASGFQRDMSNYKKSVAKGAFLNIVLAVISVFTGGAVSVGYGMPLRHVSQLYVMIVDVEANEIVYYNNTTKMDEECDPLDLTLQRRRLERLFRKFK